MSALAFPQMIVPSFAARSTGSRSDLNARQPGRGVPTAAISQARISSQRGCPATRPSQKAIEDAANADASGIVWLQVGYAIADMTAKAGFGLLIYFIARAKSKNIDHDLYPATV
jgi:hypothetical protein